MRCGDHDGLTKSFNELVQRRVASDADFAATLLREGIDTMLTGDVETGKVLLDYAPLVISAPFQAAYG
jgi:hypothetical protein